MHPVFALATPPAKSAICVFRVSGEGCLVGLSKIIKKKSFEPGRFHVRGFYNGDQLVDKAGLLVFKGPNIVSKINDELLEIIKKTGVNNISELVGSKNKLD